MLDHLIFKLGKSLCYLWKFKVKYSNNHHGFPILEHDIVYIPLKYQCHSNVGSLNIEAWQIIVISLEI